MIKVNPSNGNETKSEIFPWDAFKPDTMFFHQKNNSSLSIRTQEEDSAPVFKLKIKANLITSRTYHAKYPSELCVENYISESGKCIADRVTEHNGRDHRSYI